MQTSDVWDCGLVASVAALKPLCLSSHLMMNGVWVGYMQFIVEYVDECLFWVETLQTLSAVLWSRSRDSRSHNRKWVVCPTWHFLSDALTYFSTCVIIKVKRTDFSRKQLSEREREPGQWPFVFRGSLSPWRVGSGVKAGGSKRMLYLHKDMQRILWTLKQRLCGQWTLNVARYNLLS